MTLFKQLALLISLLLLTILLTVMYLNFETAKESVQNRLYEDAQNTAASLSLSLGTAGGDEMVMETMINANFDSGHYAFISLEDTDGKTIYKRVKENQEQSVPRWFKEIVHIQAPIARANVSSGWSPVGILNVQSDDSYAYQHLYKTTKDLLVSFGIIYFAALIFLSILLKQILKPLHAIQKQAEAITKNEFIVIKELPYTKEFKDVVLAMNKMVQKVQTMFQKANEELKKLKEREYTDAVTKLKNRKYLLNKLPEYLKIDAKYKHGTNILIAFSGVIEANKQIGYKKVDEMFVRFAQMLQESVKSQESIVARMNGTEFDIFLPGCNVYEALDIAKQIQLQTQKIVQEFGLNHEEVYIDIGLHEYIYKNSISELLAMSDMALAKAKLSKDHLHHETVSDIEDVMTKEEWRTLFSNVLKNRGVVPVVYKVLDTKKSAIHHEVITITLQSEDKFYTYGHFIAAAIQVGMVHEIYRFIIEAVLKNHEGIFEKAKRYSLRLSNEFLEEKENYNFIQKVLKEYGKKLEFELVFELPDRFVSNSFEMVALYKKLAQSYEKISLGLFEFIGESSDYGYLQELKPTFIKSEKDFFLSIEEYNLNALKILADSVDIDLIAVSVMDKESLEKLQKRDIHIVQGRVVELIQK